MKNLQIFKMLFCTMIVAFASVSCSDEKNGTSGPDNKTPTLELSASEVVFNEAGGLKTLNINTTGKWVITGHEDASWLKIRPSTSGEGNRTIMLNVENSRTERNVSLTIKLYTLDGVELDSKPLVIKQILDPLYKDVILYEGVGTSELESSNVSVESWKSWLRIGSGAENVVYEGGNSVVTNNGTLNAGAYPGASGANFITFSKEGATFVIKNIKMPADVLNLQLYFGGAYVTDTMGGSPEYLFPLGKLLVHYSIDGGATWVGPLTYLKNDGDQTAPYWVYCDTRFSLDAPATTLAIKFTATVSSAFRIDDVRLAERKIE